MNDAARIEFYLKKMRTAFPPCSKADTDDVIRETKSHLLERSAEGRLEEALSALGAPEQYAAKFSDNSLIQNSLFSLAEIAFRMSLSVCACVIAVIFLIAAIMEIANPADVGLWISSVDRHFVLGLYEGANPNLRDVLGPLMLPAALLTSGVCFVIIYGQARWLMGRHKS